ncbi:MFS transporter [Amaricoccus solimangrovi]|uniref:MFS transporter n=1 Tax=Amaricoccus solimangrovi TaxID=2589815 RepID=UPI001F47737A|nr:MFS transporter [Amaricoccus solimangrovi]
MIAALGIAQILAWGSSYYLLAVLADPISRDTGWRYAWVVGGVSLGLLAAGLVSVHVGRRIGARGGRGVLGMGAVLLAAGLTAMAAAPTLPFYLAAWLLIGAGMGAGLYDAAFATLGGLYGTSARRAITTLTLWGGFASTICWPLSAWLLEVVGWRGTCLAYAGLHLGVTLPLILLALPKHVRAETPEVTASAAIAVRGAVFWLLAAILTTGATIAAIWSVHLITLLEARGLSLAAAVGLGALVGPAQVGARVIEMAAGGRHHPIWTLGAAAALIAAGLTLLWSGAGLVAGGADRRWRGQRHLVDRTRGPAAGAVRARRLPGADGPARSAEPRGPGRRADTWGGGPRAPRGRGAAWPARGPGPA